MTGEGKLLFFFFLKEVEVFEAMLSGETADNDSQALSSSCPRSALLLHCLCPCASVQAFSRQAAHSRDSLGILDVPLARQELPGVSSPGRAMGRVERGPHRPSLEIRNLRSYEDIQSEPAGKGDVPKEEEEPQWLVQSARASLYSGLSTHPVCSAGLDALAPQSEALLLIS